VKGGALLIIRRFANSDIPQLIKMRFEFTAEYKDIDPDLYEPFYEECELFFRDIIDSDRWHIWVAEVDGKIVTHVFLEITDTVPRPGRKKSPFGYITNVYTIPNFRCKGIGGRVMEEINLWAKGHGLTFLMVWPSETSVDFYKTHGYDLSQEVMVNYL
jgi:GNAT superfamily N-acetyltransferase